MRLPGGSIPHLALVTVAAVLIGLAASAAQAGKPVTQAYDGFNTGAGAGSYEANARPFGYAPTLNVVGFDDKGAWDISTSAVYMRPASIRELKHNLLEGTQPGSMGHWVFNGVRTLRRDLPAAPQAKSGVYTLSLLICTWPNDKFHAKPDCNGHTTGCEGKYGMIGFTPDNGPMGRKSSTAECGDNGKKGLSLGYYEKTLRVFAGGKSFVIVDDDKEGVTYLLMAQMTVNKDGPEYIRGFYAVDGDKELTPAKFNAENGGKGVEVETWSSPADMIEMELYMNDYDNWIPGKANIRPDNDPTASWGDRKKVDYISWDEVRLQDGKAVVPVPNDKGDPQFAKAAAEARKALTAKPELPPRLAAYWAFDEGTGNASKDTVGAAGGALVRCGPVPSPAPAQWVKDGVIGSAIHGDCKQGPKYGPHFAQTFSVPHDAVQKGDLPWERFHKLTYTAWIRGGDDFKGTADIITKAGGGRIVERAFADIKGIGFMVFANVLELELTNSIMPDNRLKVQSNLAVPGDNKWHHVAVTYDGSSKAAGVTFYVDGVKDGPVKVVEDMLTADIGTLNPYCVGGRALKDDKDGASALTCGYTMVGDVDEAGVFSYALRPGQVIAIYSLAQDKDLNYNLSQVNQLIEMHKAKTGTIEIGGKTWEYVAGGLAGGLGKLDKKDGKSAVQLGDDGSGIKTK
ncbi:MAG TPA: LamG-like jellyroll fold domain-containing protein [Phycisphaerae bacterium]|nr:LamG-like jellyroll fold domain-containing protein [Phycisphaerae bacterium]